MYGIHEKGSEVVFPGAALACIDRAGTSIDPDVVLHGMQLTDPSLSDEERVFIGTVYDECFSRATRVAMFAETVTFAGEPVTGEDAVCVAEAVDDSIMQHGGFSSLAGDVDGQTTLLQRLFAALASCGVMGG
ncbi:MAG: hypothetical protein ABMA25_08330 [Ilumatobacteraceae bacterium]